LAADPSAVPAARGPTALDELQGVWHAVAGRRRASFIIKGDRFTFRFDSGETYAGRLTVDATPDPRHMDIQVEEGPAKHRGKLVRCIYQFDEEDCMHWCPGKPGEAERLSYFPSVRDERFLSLVFKRE